MMRLRPLVIAAALIGLLVTTTTLALADYAVGKTTLSVSGSTALRGDPSSKLHVIVWYPAPKDTPMRDDAIGPPGNPHFLAGEVALDAGVSRSLQPFPLIVLSHGTGGSAMQMAWLGTALAAQGFIAAAVDHPGNNAVTGYTAPGFALWWLRAADLSRTIDAVLADPRLGPRTDHARIGAAGFSLGGYTVLELAGARTSLDRFKTYCDATKSPICAGPPEFPDMTTQMQKLLPGDLTLGSALDAAGISYRDPRVKAVFAIAPSLVPALVPETLKAISIPVFIVAGFGDPEVNVADNALAAATLIPTANLRLLPHDVGHYIFLNVCTEAGRKANPPLCVDEIGRQQQVHDDTAAMAAAFFNRAL